jgi:hypothetical protein
VSRLNRNELINERMLVDVTFRKFTVALWVLSMRSPVQCSTPKDVVLIGASSDRLSITLN